MAIFYMSSGRLNLLVLSVISILLPLAVSTSCYHPNGQNVDNGIYQPCNNTTGFSMCCATHKDSGVDACLSNGLCFNECTDDGVCGPESVGQYWRESCTDPTWNSPFCLKGICTNPADNGSPSSDMNMTQCAVDGSWCCGGSMTSIECCASDNRFNLAAVIGVSSTTSILPPSAPSTTLISTLSAASTTLISKSIDSPNSVVSHSSSPSSATISTGASTTSSSVSKPSATSSSSASEESTSNTSTPNKTDNKAEKIGFGVGIAGVLVAVLALLIMFLKLKRRQKLPTNNQFQEQGSIQKQGSILYPLHPPSQSSGAPTSFQVSPSLESPASVRLPDSVEVPASGIYEVHGDRPRG